MKNGWRIANIAAPLAVLLAVWIAPRDATCAPVISEFLASGSRLLDEDGDASDWIEILNPGPGAVDLSLWYLSDDAGNLRRWRLPDSPDLVLAPGEYLVVFASGKNRHGPQLHASFALSSDGEFLALVEPDGLTIAHAYAPSYPRQRDGASYGLTTHSETFVAADASASVLVPTDGTLGTAWPASDFAPGVEWTDGHLGVGFDRSEEPQVVPEGLVGYWSFDAHLDDAANGNDGVFRGAAEPNWVDGFDGEPLGAIRLDGVDDYVEVTHRVDLPIYDHAAFSVSMWVKGGPQPDKRVFSEGSASTSRPVFNIGTDNTGGSGAVDIYIRDAGGSTAHSHTHSASAAFDDAWHHIAWVDDDGDATLWIDGVRDTTNFSYARPDLPVNRTSIGAILRAADSHHFDGVIDDVSLWNRTLTPGEIVELAGGAHPTGIGGSGYRAHIRTDLEATMLDAGHSGAYLRVPFAPDDLDALATLTLRVRYDDGFVAYVNGVEVARRNAPADSTWNSLATLEREPADALTVEVIDLSDRLDLLRPDANVLAVHALNAAADDPDFLFAAELTGAGELVAEARYFTTPTPGAPNGGGSIDWVADTTFSVDRGLFFDPFDVAVDTATEGATIRYTIDGSEPTATHGEVYSGPLRIDTTTTLRAAAFRDGFEPSNIDTQSYIFPDHVLRQTRPAGYPTTWSGTPAAYDMNPAIVDDPDFADSMVDSLLSLQSVSVVLPFDSLIGPSGIYSNPQNSGRGWERASSLELLRADGRGGFQVDAGVRITGNRSRGPGNSPKHGLRFIFRGEYGATKLRYKLFEDSPVERFDTISVKPNAFDSWVSVDSSQRQGATYIRDHWVRDAQRDTGHPTSHGFWVHLYINGIYWGVYDLGERPDASFGASYWGGDKENWDAIKNHEEVVDGNITAYRELDALRATDLSTPDGWDAFRQYVDVENMTDYMIANMVAPATDWPGNYYMVRERRPGAGFKFISWDAEYAFLGGVNNNRTLPHRRDADSPTKFYHAIRVNTEYQTLFGDHVHRHFFHDGALTPEAIDARWLESADEIYLALQAESARWGDYRRGTPYRPDVEWRAEERYLREDYFPVRTGIVLEQFRALDLYPDVEAPEFNRHGGDIEPGFRLTMSAPAGSIWYTLDGSDPRLEGGAISPEASEYGFSDRITLLGSGASARVHVPTDDRLGLDWTNADFNDDAWTAGTTGLGYERTSGYEDLIATDLSDAMDGINATFYARVAFDVERPEELDALTLRMKYDDGFVAWLNGVEIARRNAPEILAWNASATAPHTDAQAVVFEDIDVSEHLERLAPDRNVLAIQGMNSSAGSSDLLIVPELAATELGGALPDLVFEESTRARARALVGDEWSALTDAVFAVDTGLRVTEIQYHPVALDGDIFDPDEFEYIELTNTGSEPIDLRGVRFTRGVEFDFTTSAVTELAPGEIVVIVEDIAAFAARYDIGAILVAGAYSGKLENSGETLKLVGSLDETILEFAYSDLWHPSTDGEGPSLVIDDPGAARSTWSDGASWHPSRFPLGSPGWAESDGDGGLQRPGNLNQDANVDISDSIALLRWLFGGAAQPLPCGDGTLGATGNIALIDVNDDTRVDLSDGVYLLAYLFQGGSPPVRGTSCVPIETCPDACSP